MTSPAYTRRPVFRSGANFYWKGSERVLTPQDAILDENGIEILDEIGLPLLTE